MTYAIAHKTTVGKGQSLWEFMFRGERFRKYMPVVL